MDGYTAAWACWLVHPDWEFVPGVYGYDENAERFQGRDVFFLDFSYKRPVMEKIIAVARTVTVIDHHVSAESDLKPLFDDGLIKGVFDMKHSGAYLAWKWFHPNERVPHFVAFVEDRDLWRFNFQETRPVCDAIFSHAYSFEMWDQFRALCDDNDGVLTLIKEGEAIGRKQAKDVAELTAKLKYHGMIGGKIVPIVNVPYTYASDVGNLLYEQNPDAPFTATYFYDGDKYIFSLRSADHGADVSEVAKLYGGGGHKHAAGFQISRMEDLR